MKFSVVGSGFSGCILAYYLSEFGHDVDVYESRNHIGGNCYTYRDKETNILVHKYGPHIFHTDKEHVWDFINLFTEFTPYVNRVKANAQGKIFSLPINLHTINQFFGKTLSPNQAKSFIASLSDECVEDVVSFEDQALKFIGKDLYEAFFKGYTIKQWGINPKDLPASILKRLPVRFNYDDNYFSHKYQGMPTDGYTPIFDKLLSSPNIKLSLNHDFNSSQCKDYDHIFYTGPIDAFFSHKFGQLAYRTLDFREERHDGDYQGCAVLNYNDIDVPYTRITEHKYFSPHESHSKTIIFKEFSRDASLEDTKYYPVRLVKDKDLLLKYISEAEKLGNVSFLGRLGTYRYLDMDVTISEALDAKEIILEKIASQQSIPCFFSNVL